MIDSVLPILMSPWVVAGLAAVSATLVVAGIIMWLRRRRKPKGVIVYLLEKPQEKPKSADKRSSLRRKGHPVDVIITDEKGGNERRGIVLDRSMSGMCLSSDIPVKVGEIVRVRRVGASKAEPWLRLQVRNCRFAVSNYELGCLFVETPPASVLIHFG
ncbi:MAG: hypothetical protein KatS3mg105_2544 [Gemmatales bacterium]|nr:MAG: hypothetical protein KatS3mg105_2544 [Gemmatales bacterium]